jgi:CHAT domain-containing protein
MLGLLPLPALPSERLTISLIPSARAWKAAVDAIEARVGNERRFLAVDNPSGDLDFASSEIDTIESRFAAGSRRLCGSQVTKAELISAARGATHLHFACHGIYQPIRPLESALLLAGRETLTVRDLLDGALDLSASRLAVLSACETGVFDVRTAPDEVLGLPAGLLQAGVPGVVSSLWRVDDMATSLLMSRFYADYLGGDLVPLSPARALRRAQLWLRDVTAVELSRLCEEAGRRPAGESFLSREAASRLGLDLAFEDDGSRPYSDPYFWAPFVFMGA